MKNSYDEVPYPAAAYSQTHPENMRLVAKLMGVAAIPVNKCRVLEIGCANGGNIFPLAELYPNSDFVGIDYSSVQIDEAKRRNEILKHDNIQFYTADVSEVPSDLKEKLGFFDYIICHGVFSWVDERVRQAILCFIKEHLSDDGVSFLSYNCYPGWKIREVARDMMLYHGDQFQDPSQKYNQAKAMAQFVHENRQGESDIYGKLLEDTLKIINSTSASYVFHEYLEKTNHPFYFHEIAELADNEGFVYLGDAVFSEMFTYGLDAKTEESLQKVAGNDLIKREQYLDFLKNRFFRNSLFVHKGKSINRTIPIDSAKSLYYIANCAPKDNSKLDTATYNVNGKQITANNPLVISALNALIEQFPDSLSFNELLNKVSSKFPDVESNLLEKTLSESILRLVSMGGVVAMTHTPPVPAKAEGDENPYGLAFSRLISKNSDTVSNSKHGNVKLTALQRVVLQNSDGLNNCETIVNNIYKMFTEKQLVLNKDSENSVMPSESDVKVMVDNSILQLRKLSLVY